MSQKVEISTVSLAQYEICLQSWPTLLYYHVEHSSCLQIIPLCICYTNFHQINLPEAHFLCHFTIPHECNHLNMLGCRNVWEVLFNELAWLLLHELCLRTHCCSFWRVSRDILGRIALFLKNRTLLLLFGVEIFFTLVLQTNDPTRLLTPTKSANLPVSWWHPSFYFSVRMDCFLHPVLVISVGFHWERKINRYS